MEVGQARILMKCSGGILKPMRSGDPSLMVENPRSDAEVQSYGTTNYDIHKQSYFADKFIFYFTSFIPRCQYAQEGQRAQDAR
ncbi:hypothetical protein AVEN_157441-1 [Araneus ventricosus]|uniref:Uncharacterized protein n=1 Tax=Araneus ventricosus TaxID=182803 RepID=A0A4Y2TYB5_ARAVE|nr:hypothetical protein AVEN_157441-1 [Araneus ventricosus]